MNSRPPSLARHIERVALLEASHQGALTLDEAIRVQSSRVWAFPWDEGALRVLAALERARDALRLLDDQFEVAQEEVQPLRLVNE